MTRTTMRAALPALLVVGLALGCGCDDDAVPAAVASEPARVASAPSSAASAGAAPVSPPTAPAPEASAPLTAAERTALLREIGALVREGRRLERAGDHAAALARFDAALHIHAGNPRVLCEAGLVAHHAGDDDAARVRMDTALRLFGAPTEVAAALRVPLAMCFYNRGLVAEALHLGDAAAHYRASLALRPNATVEARLAAVEAMPDGESAEDDASDDPSDGFISWNGDDAGTITGTEIERLDDAVRVRTHDATVLESVLEAGLGSMDEFTEDLTSATVRLALDARAPAPLSTHVLVFVAADGGYPIETEYLVVAVERDDGYEVVAVVSGMADVQDFNGASGGTGVEVPEGAVPSWAGGLFRLDLESENSDSVNDVEFLEPDEDEDGEDGEDGEDDDDDDDDERGECYRISNSVEHGTLSLLCALDGPTCLVVQTSRGPRRTEAGSDCPGDPPSETEESVEDAFSIVLGVEADGRVTLSEPTGHVPTDLTPVLGAHTLSELAADADDESGERRVARPPSMRTDEDLARIEAEHAGAD